MSARTIFYVEDRKDLYPPSVTEATLYGSQVQAQEAADVLQTKHLWERHGYYNAAMALWEKRVAKHECLVANGLADESDVTYAEPIHPNLEEARYMVREVQVQ